MKQKGFTLIELLIVIAILGVVAAVVALNIGNFIGRGSVEAANTETSQVRTAIIAYITDENYEEINTIIGPEANYPIDAPSTEGVHQYLANPGNLQADYVIEDSWVVNATPIEGSRWGDIHFCEGSWQLDPCG